MQEIIIDTYNYSSRLEKMAASFGSTVSDDCGEYSFSFNNVKGEGTIKGISFDHGISLMIIDARFNETTKFQYKLGRRHPIQCLFTNTDSIKLISPDLKIINDAEENNAILYAPLGYSEYGIEFPANTKVQCVIVSAIRFLFMRKIECDIETIPETLREMFNDTVGKNAFYFGTVTEPLTINNLKNLFMSDGSGLERKLLMEANSLSLITNLIKRFRIESSSNQGEYRFSKTDINLINKAKNHIIDNISFTPTVKELSMEIGMNTNKLQRGFHLLFGKSIRQFTITLKMHIALGLMDERELSISEIAYKIGYTNKGHFSQLFKKEFGVLPSVYLMRIPQPI